MRRVGIRIGAVLSALGLATYGAVASGASGTHGQIVATCANTSTDAATINNAITGSAPGAVIMIQGTCLLTSPITLLGNRTYTGGNSGAETNTTKPTGTILVQGASMGYVLASDTYVSNSTTSGDPLTIRDMTVSCNKTGTTDGVVIKSWLADVEHLYVTGCPGSGIVDTSAAGTGKITNTSVNSRFKDNFIEDSGKYGFYVQDDDSSSTVTDGFFSDNQVSNSGIDGIHLDNAAGWLVSGNHLYGDGQNGIYAHRMYGTTISDNYIEDFATKQTSGTYYGIETDVQGDPVGSTISGNKVLNDGDPESATATYTYISIDQTNYGTGNVAVTGNVIVGRQNSDTGLSFTGGTSPLLVSSTGNRVSGVGTARHIGTNATVDAGV